MNYRSHYDRLIARAKDRVIGGYVEVHHVVPRCMGGGNEKTNLVQLTPEEHFVAHQFLHKIYPDVPGLSFALINMTGNPYGQRNNKAYGWIRKKHAVFVSKSQKEIWQRPGHREKMKVAMDKVRARPGYGEQFSRIQKGRIKSAEEIANFVRSKTGMKYKPMSAESRENMAAARRKTWAERRANGTDKEIAAKTWATRRKNALGRSALLH